MASFLSANIILSLASSLLSLVLFLYFLAKSRHSALTNSFLFFQFVTFLYPLPEVLHSALLAFGIKDALLHKYACTALNYFTICFIGTSWLIFCLYFINSGQRLKKALSVSFLCVSLFLFIFFMQRRTTSLSSDAVFNVRLQLKSIILLTSMLLGILLLLLNRSKQPGYIKKQSTLLITAIMLPLVVIMYYAYTEARFADWIIPFTRRTLYIDLVPVSLSVTTLIIAVSTFKFRFLNLMPIASKKIFENMNEAFIVIDTNDIISDFNPAFLSIFMNAAQFRGGDDAGIFYNTLQTCMTAGAEVPAKMGVIREVPQQTIDMELEFLQPERKYFSVRIQPVFQQDREVIGKIISFTEITAYTDLMHELKEKNDELTRLNNALTDANSQLKEYAATAEQLAIIKERNRMAGEVHDTLGHTLTLLLMLTKASCIVIEKDPAETKLKLNSAIEIIKSGINELKWSVAGIANGNIQSGSLFANLEKLVQDSKAAGTSVDLVIEGYAQENTIPSDILYRLCQEAITNAIRHGKAENISIVLRFNGNFVKILVIDDGVGCKEVKEGFGLSGMKKRISESGGTMDYGSDGEKGFCIFAELPLSELSDIEFKRSSLL